MIAKTQYRVNPLNLILDLVRCCVLFQDRKTKQENHL